MTAEIQPSDVWTPFHSFFFLFFSFYQHLHYKLRLTLKLWNNKDGINVMNTVKCATHSSFLLKAWKRTFPPISHFFSTAGRNHGCTYYLPKKYDEFCHIRLHNISYSIHYTQANKGKVTGSAAFGRRYKELLAFMHSLPSWQHSEKQLRIQPHNVNYAMCITSWEEEWIYRMTNRKKRLNCENQNHT